MPKVSRETASNVVSVGPMESHSEQVGDFIVDFSTFHEAGDATPLLKGLPDDRCQAAHWGYIFKGRLTFRYADREEVYEAGDAYYAPPGHIPVVEAGTEAVEFSTAAEYAQTLQVLEKNIAALQVG
ncbi:MAG: cupin domain-containing protein [Solirubrobacteraceae bacterium]